MQVKKTQILPPFTKFKQTEEPNSLKKGGKNKLHFSSLGTSWFNPDREEKEKQDSCSCFYFGLAVADQRKTTLYRVFVAGHSSRYLPSRSRYLGNQTANQ